MGERVLSMCVFDPVGTGCRQTPRKSGISGCRNSIKSLLIFASGNPMLATRPLESLKLWDVSIAFRCFLSFFINVSKSIRYADYILCFKYERVCANIHYILCSIYIFCM